MKGLLLKEFYIWLKSRSWYILIILAYGIVFAATYGSRSTFILWFALISLSRAFADDEASNWRNYSHALPYTPAQIVSARYIFLLAEVIIASIITTVSVIISFLNSESADFIQAFPYLSDSWITASNMTVIITVLLLGFSFTMPLNYKFTGNARIVISIIPSMISMFAIIIISLNSMFSSFLPDSRIPKTFYNEKWLFAAFAAVSVLALAASWSLCVIFTAKNKSRTKKLKAITAVMITAFVAVSAVTIGITYTKGSFEKDEEEENALLYQYYHENYTPPTQIEEERKDIVTDEQQKCREELKFLTENFFNISHENHHLEDCLLELEELGLKEVYSSSFYEYSFSEESETVVSLYPETNSDRIFQISISSAVGETYIEKATTEELNEIGSNFKLGMTEQELFEVYKKYELYPCYVEEKHDTDIGTTHYYYAKFFVANYNSGESTLYKVHVDLTDGKVTDVRLYDK